MTTTIVIDGSKIPEQAVPRGTGRIAQPRAATGTAGAKLTFGGLVKSERIKLLSLRSVRVTLFITLLMGLGLATLIGSMFAAEISMASAEDLQSYLLTTATFTAPFLALIFGVLGVLVMSSEYASGLIQSTLVAAPRRGRVFAAKGLVLAVISALTAVVIVLGGLGIATAIYPQAANQLASETVLTAVAGTIAYLVMLSLFAYGIATLTRNAAAGIGIVAGVTFVLPIAMQMLTMTNWTWVPTVSNLLPAQLGQVLGMGTVQAAQYVEFMGSGFGYWPALALMAAWVAVAIVPALATFKRRDAK